ncbi:MAG: hypothetical protein M3256_27870 [Actinomycetota bacterium]|nr:hypothetical protein [Actinomycetota bacterium]
MTQHPAIPLTLTRRRFLGHASVGAAAAGALAAGGASVFSSAAGADAASRLATPDRAGRPSAPDGPLQEGSGVIAHVVDAKTGQISLLVGTREIAYTNREMAQQLLRAAQ